MATKTLQKPRSTITRSVKKDIKVFRLGELFCGPGGIGLGAVSAQAETLDKIYRIEHAWANDYDADACRTYVRNICPANPDSVICCDVRTLNIEALPPIDAFAYGFPCNDFSKYGEVIV